MRKICQIIAASGLIAGLAAPASASSITFVTPAGSTTSGGAVAASAAFTTSANSLSITLTNLLANPKDVAQLLSDLFFTVSDPSLVTGSVTSSSAQQVTVNDNGSTTLGSTGSTAWQLAALGSGKFHLDELCGTGNGCATPSELIIGPAGAGGVYTNANNSIAGNDPHNPFLMQTATFVLGINGLSSSDTITAATFSFGTTTGINVTGQSCPDCGATQQSVVPEPASLALLGSGLIGAGIRRWRNRRTAA